MNRDKRKTGTVAVSSPPARPAANSPPVGGSQTSSQQQNVQATRETFESVVIAVILAFLFRGFVAEAFVIPTGSMAPTLQGRHVDVQCPECNYSYRSGASDENEGEGVVLETYCPICRYPLPLIPPEQLASLAEQRRDGDRISRYQLDRMRSPNERSFNGDRILVTKFAYDMAEPQRWDVAVFKYPGNAKQNYIKRLIGLPNELIRIRHGDIFIWPYLFSSILATSVDAETEPGSILEGLRDGVVNDALRQAFQRYGIQLSDQAELEVISDRELPKTDPSQEADIAWYVSDQSQRFLLRLPRGEVRLDVYGQGEIARKPADKELALLQVVDDTRYRSQTLTRLGWPNRWQQSDEAEPVWQSNEDGSSFQVEAVDQPAWLRYRHIYPSEAEWQRMLLEQKLPESLERARGELISDYYTYNDNYTYKDGRAHERFRQQFGYHWVGDLAVVAEVDVQSAAGELLLDLVEGGVHYRCTIDVATGQAVLSKTDGEPFIGPDGSTEQPTAQTSLRGPGSYQVRFSNVDDQLRLWVDDTVAEFDGPTTYANGYNTVPRWSADDPGDLSPLGVGARKLKMRINRLQVFRDVYYIATYQQLPMYDYASTYSEEELQEIFSNPHVWQSTNLFGSRREVEFVMRDDQFFPLGDNSPHSQDGRKWDRGPYFERELLIGKALFIYWPHAWRRPIPYLTINFRRMRFIR